MKKIICTSVCITCSSLVIGRLSYSGIPQLMPLALLILPLWYYSPNRFYGFLTFFVYSAATSYALPSSVATYSSIPPANAILLWFSASILPSTPFFLFHFKDRTLRILGLYIALVLCALPPFGLTCWSHPLTCIGTFWPSGGWFALVATILLLPLICRHPSILVIPIALGLCIDQTPVNHAKWAAINTNFNGSTTANEFSAATMKDFMFDYQRQTKEIEQINSKNLDVVLLPESAGGSWFEANVHLWKTRLKPNVFCMVNAAITNQDTTKDSVIFAINKESVKLIYRQRQPVPFTMWNPWRDYTYNVHWFENPVVDFQGEKIAFFVCYEQLLMWTALHSFSHKPTVICALSNIWWAKNGNVPAIQHSTMLAWSNLFNVPLITATNT